jgi:hypothetical protein
MCASSVRSEDWDAALEALIDRVVNRKYEHRLEITIALELVRVEDLEPATISITRAIRASVRGTAAAVKYTEQAEVAFWIAQLVNGFAIEVDQIDIRDRQLLSDHLRMVVPSLAIAQRAQLFGTKGARRWLQYAFGEDQLAEAQKRLGKEGGGVKKRRLEWFR